MKKQWIASALLFTGTLAFSGVYVIVPYEEEKSEKPAKTKALSEEQKKQESLYRERLKARDAMRRSQQKAQEEFNAEQRKKREERQKAEEQRGKRPD